MVQLKALVGSFLLIVLVLLHGQCFAQKNADIIKIEHRSDVVLKENQMLLGNISDMVVDERRIYVLDDKNKKVIEYDLNGSQVNHFGNEGRGPYEFEDPALLTLDNDTIYVWDKELLRLVGFTKAGDPTFELSNFNNAISKIDKNGRYLATYNSGGFEGSIITLYDLGEKKIINTFGSKSEAHKLLMRMDGSGAMHLDKSHVLFSRADETVVKKYDLSGELIKEVELELPDFQVEKPNQTARHMVNKDREKMFSFLANNSRIVSLIALDEYYVLISKVGTLTRGSDAFKNRETLFIMLDKDIEPLKTIKIDNKLLNSTTLIEGEGNAIYFISWMPEKGAYNLSRWEIE